MKEKLPLILLNVLMLSVSAWAQFRLPTEPVPTPARKPLSAERAALDKQIAAQFAPVIYQGLGDQPRFDYITNFDFDRDWNGDNNWANAANKTYPLRAYVYYSVIETATHYFVHYAFFHPRDYKGGLAKSTLIDALIKEGVRRAGKDPTGLADDVALSHENDLEGALVVAEKRGNELGNAAVQYVETMSHNRYLKYRPRDVPGAVGDGIEMDGQQPLLFVEPKGHGVSNYTSTTGRAKKAAIRMLVYAYTGNAEDPDKKRRETVGYDLVAIYETLWPRAQTGEGETFAEIVDYQELKISLHQLEGQAVLIERQPGKLGAAFRGTVGFKNKARPPWGWYDSTEPDRPRGEWFFDPATVIARHFNLDATFAQSYTYHPYFQISDAAPER